MDNTHCGEQIYRGKPFGKRNYGKPNQQDSKPHLFVAGLVRDAEKTLSKELNRIALRLSPYFDLDWIIIESDSSDNSVAVLENFKSANKRFDFKSLGSLRNEIPDRVERICHCRNNYLAYIRNHERFNENSWILIMDLDNLNRKIDGKAVLRTISTNLADAYFANQSGPYYDIFALRHSVWNPRDFSSDKEVLILSGANEKQATDIAVFSKMIRIPKEVPIFYVDSAFGGLGLYKGSTFINCDYSTFDGESHSVCEHVGLHRKMRAEGHRLAIKPDLINAKYTEHTIRFHPIAKWIFRATKFARQPLVSVLGESKALKAFDWFLSKFKLR